MAQHKSIDRGTVATMVLTGLRDVLTSSGVELPPTLAKRPVLSGARLCLILLAW